MGVGNVLAEQKHFKLSSQRSLEAVATEKAHYRCVLCRRIAIISILVLVISFIAIVVGGLLYEKVSSEHQKKKDDEERYAPLPEGTSRGMRGGVTGIALASLRDLQKMHGGELSTLRAVAFELDAVPQLKTIDRIERTGETYTLYFDTGNPGEQLSFTTTTFIFMDGEGKSHILSPNNRR